MTYATAEAVAQLNTDMDTLFVFICAILVFFMHTGFAMLEAGGVQVFKCCHGPCLNHSAARVRTTP